MNWKPKFGQLSGDLIIGVVLMVLFTAIPLFGPSRYVIGQLTLFFLWATVVTQWNLVFGVAGILSLGHMALFAFGGYMTGMLGLYLDWSLWFALPVAGLGTVVFSILIGLACLRLRGAYVALLTLCLAQVMYLLIITDTYCFFMDGVTCRNFTGGTRGLTKYGDFGFRAILGRDWIIGDYYLTLVVLAMATVFSIIVISSPLGFAFRALRDNEEYAVSRGINRFKFQLIVFASSAFFTGLAGGVYAGHFKVMGANTLYLSLMLYLLAMMVIGGLGHPWGPFLGAAALMLVDEVLKDFISYRYIVLGLIIILFSVLWPHGITGAIDKLWQRLRTIKRKQSISLQASATQPGIRRSDH